MGFCNFKGGSTLKACLVDPKGLLMDAKAVPPPPTGLARQMVKAARQRAEEQERGPRRRRRSKGASKRPPGTPSTHSKWSRRLGTALLGAAGASAGE